MSVFVRKVEVGFNGLCIRGYIPTFLGKMFGYKVRWTVFPKEGSWILNDSAVPDEMPVTEEGIDASSELGNYTITLQRNSWREMDGPGSADTVAVITRGTHEILRQQVFQDGRVTKPMVLAFEDMNPEMVMPLD